MRFNTAGYMCSNQTRVVFNPSVGTYIFLFRNVTVRDPWHNSYQYLVLGYPRGALLREHSEYLGSLKRPPPPAPDHPDKGGRNIRGPTEGRTEA